MVNRSQRNRRLLETALPIRRDPLVFKDDEQQYAQVLRMLGSSWCEVECCDGLTRQCRIRGNMHKRVWVRQGDIVLVSLRDFNEAKSDIIAKYSDAEARKLKKQGEFPVHSLPYESTWVGLEWHVQQRATNQIDMEDPIDADDLSEIDNEDPGDADDLRR